MNGKFLIVVDKPDGTTLIIIGTLNETIVLIIKLYESRWKFIDMINVIAIDDLFKGIEWPMKGIKRHLVPILDEVIKSADKVARNSLQEIKLRCVELLGDWE